MEQEKKVEDKRVKKKESINFVQVKINKWNKGKMVSVNIPYCMLYEFKKKRKNNLEVITLATKLLNYIMQITENAPKKYRYTFVNRLVNYALEILDNINRASLHRKDIKSQLVKRQEYQKQAYTDLKMLGFFSEIAFENKVIAYKKYAIISQQVDYLMERLYIWMTDGLEKTA